VRRVIGTLRRISGPIIECDGASRTMMLELVHVGDERLLGEVIRLEGDRAVIQVYEDTTELKPGAQVYGTGNPMVVELGPGVIGSVYDGVQRPLPVMRRLGGDFINRGFKVDPLPRDKKWAVQMRVRKGDFVQPGQVIAVVQETGLVEHRVCCPPDTEGEVVYAATSGDRVIDDTIVKVRTESGEKELSCLQYWPVRTPRPYRQRLAPSVPLITGQRVIDTFFPLAKGGAAAVPGGFGTGKTRLQHQLAKWSDADIIIYIGCGERGNEMTEVLREFPELEDPRTGRPLMERTILIANTSNMPVSAREASIYTGVTIGEYYRDMGYHVALMADSTSRWAEALRELSGRLEEMPAEEGFPPYLASRLAEFYERGGMVETLGGSQGSLSIIGAVSPPGGDFSEPVTQHTKRFVRCFWGLDKDLADERHYPAVNWTQSYSEYIDDLSDWWTQNGAVAKWREHRDRAMQILQEEDRLQQIARLVGPEALPDNQRLYLETASLIKEGFLQQNALDEVDTYCSMERQLKMLQLIILFHDRAEAVIKQGAPIVKIREMDVVLQLRRMKAKIGNDEVEKLDDLREQLTKAFDKLDRDYR